MAKPVVVLSRADAQCATFFWPVQPDYFVGYRFIEHDPETLDAPLEGIESMPSCEWGDLPSLPDEERPSDQVDPWNNEWLGRYEESNEEDAIQLSFRSFADGSAWARGHDNRGEQTREFFFKPEDNGVAMWMRVTTREPVPGAWGVQQCLRYSGLTNQEWRQKVGRIPFLSEFDYQANCQPNQSLSFVRRGGEWLNFPVQLTWFHTPAGSVLLEDRSSGQIDHGLILRESADQKFASGMYWERTAYVSNRHHADCLHSLVDFGPLAVGEHRTVRGKFYFVEGTKDDLLAAWRSDFPNDPQATA